MKNRELKGLPFNLQFFAEENGDEGQNGDGQANGDEGSKGNENGSGEQNKNTEKTFTQQQVNDMMAKEKKQGKQAMLNALGFKSEQEAKDSINLLKALQESQKSEEQKQEEAKKAALEDKEKAEQRAILAESKLTCIENGVNKESVEDVLTIAMSKVSDDKTLESVIADMKKEKRYTSFFVDGNEGGSNGTGTTPSHSSSKKQNEDDYGKKLAERYNAKQSGDTKSKFF